MPVKSLKRICPKCRHVYESLRRTNVCPACDHRPRTVIDLSEFGTHEGSWRFVLGVLALAAVIAAVVIASII